MKPIVRQLQAQDFAEFQTLLGEFYRFAGNDIPTVKNLQKLFRWALAEKTNYDVYALEFEQHLVGLISITFGHSSYLTSPFAWCDDFFIKQEFRRRGWGKLLIAAVKQKAQKRSCSCLLVGVGAQESESILFYERAGFQDLQCKLYSLALDQSS